MGRRIKRRLSDSIEDFPYDICQPATQQEKTSWNGFCEIESEPVRSILLLQIARSQLMNFLGAVQRDASGVRSERCQGPGGGIFGRRDDGFSEVLRRTHSAALKSKVLIKLVLVNQYMA